MGNIIAIFMDGALINLSNINNIEKALNDKKRQLNLNGEIKWTKVTDNYLDKYIEIINLFFELIKKGKIKIRIMFAQNAFVTDGLTKEQTENEYSILYYFFLKEAFGLKYSNSLPYNQKVNFSFYLDDLPCSKEQKDSLKRSIMKFNYELRQNNIEITEIVEIDSKKHVIQQCLDIILGSLKTGKRSRRTIAKEKLYKVINKNIRCIRKGFNVGISTSNDNDITNIWKHEYRHWNFISKYSHFDKSLTKKNKK